MQQPKGYFVRVVTIELRLGVRVDIPKGRLDRKTPDGSALFHVGKPNRSFPAIR